MKGVTEEKYRECCEVEAIRLERGAHCCGADTSESNDDRQYAADRGASRGHEGAGSEPTRSSVV
jgi:hypothetical protein